MPHLYGELQMLKSELVKSNKKNASLESKVDDMTVAIKPCYQLSTIWLQTSNTLTENIKGISMNNRSSDTEITSSSSHNQISSTGSSSSSTDGAVNVIFKSYKLNQDIETVTMLYKEWYENISNNLPSVI
jgi:hypothetical protein